MCIRNGRVLLHDIRMRIRLWTQRTLNLPRLPSGRLINLSPRGSVAFTTYCCTIRDLLCWNIMKSLNTLIKRDVKKIENLLSRYYTANSSIINGIQQEETAMFAFLTILKQQRRHRDNNTSEPVGETLETVTNHPVFLQYFSLCAFSYPFS